MRVLVLAHFYPPEMGGAAARLHGLARWLTQYGHRVTVITGFPNYPSGVIPETYRGKLRMWEEMDGVDVLRTWVYASSHRSSVRRLANYFSFVVSATVAGLTSGCAFDVALVSSPPLFIGLAGLAIARLRRVPWVFDIRDLWPDVAVEAGEFDPGALITRLGYRLARFLYKRADFITPVTENKRRKLLDAGVPSDKLAVVANGVDLDQVTEVSGAAKRADLDLDGKFVVLYAGLIGIAQGVEIAAHAAESLRDQNDVHFLIVGDGVCRGELVRQVEERSLGNVTIVGHQPCEEMPRFLAAADVCLVPLASSNLQDAVPSKLLEAWAYNRPVILAAGGEAAALVREAEGGVVVPPEEPDRLAEAVLALRNDRERLARCARRGREYVRQRFDRRVLARRMERVLQAAVERHR
jgi:colanic acid biosynthesis glycosyl transferase WcaI